MDIFWGLSQNIWGTHAPYVSPFLRTLSKGQIHFFTQNFRDKSQLTVRQTKIQNKVKCQQQNLPRVDQHASRIPKMYCMKSQQMGYGRAVLASTANSGRFAKSGQNRQSQLVRPSYILFARISCNTYLESLKHADQPWVSFVAGF